MSWLVWVIIGVPVAVILAWGQRRDTRRIDSVRRYDPELADRMEANRNGAELPTRIRGFDRRDRF
ncbi:MAG: hypothetical protein JO144_00485 [Actinobacteria bacterium]|nr:hypothetical protein [Actinomycetota bacterium]